MESVADEDRERDLESMKFEFRPKGIRDSQGGCRPKDESSLEKDKTTRREHVGSFSPKPTKTGRRKRRNLTHPDGQPT